MTEAFAGNLKKLKEETGGVPLLWVRDFFGERVGAMKVEQSRGVTRSTNGHRCSSSSKITDWRSTQPHRTRHLPTAIGKKNWLFIGEAQAGDRSAIIYTVIKCCRRRGIDPFAYLRDVFTRLPSMTNWQVKDLTPEAWAKTRQQVDLRATA